MNFKSKINQILGVAGYSIVSKSTLDRLLAERASSVAPAPAPVSAVTVAADVQKSKFRLARTANSAPTNCAAFAPKYNPAKSPTQFARQIVEFQEHGITVIGTNAERAAAWRETETFDREFRNYNPSWDWAGSSDQIISPKIRTGLPSERLVDELGSLLSGSEFDDFFCGILGCPVTVANCRPVKSVHYSGSGVGPQDWHNDGCPLGILRGVLYLTDVDAETGPFQYKDEAGGEHTVLGKTGDLLVFDAMRLLHRALPPSRNTRTAIDLVFMPRMPDEKLEIKVAGMNHWPADPFFYTMPNGLTKPRKATA